MCLFSGTYRSIEMPHWYADRYLISQDQAGNAELFLTTARYFALNSFIPIDSGLHLNFKIGVWEFKKKIAGTHAL
jgi:hypothetical protein